MTRLQGVPVDSVSVRFRIMKRHAAHSQGEDIEPKRFFLRFLLTILVQQIVPGFFASVIFWRYPAYH